MAYEYEGKTIETNDNGYLLNTEDWSEGLAQVIAERQRFLLVDAVDRFVVPETQVGVLGPANTGR